MRQVIDGTAMTMGCTAELEYWPLESPVRNDDHALNDVARAAAKKLYGPDAVTTIPPAMGSEDFSYIMERIPSSLMVFLGCLDETCGCVYPVHNGKFKINENILHMGAAQYAQFAADYLEHNAGGDR